MVGGWGRCYESQQNLLATKNKVEKAASHRTCLRHESWSFPLMQSNNIKSFLNYVVHVNNVKTLIPQMFSRGRHQFNIPLADRGKHRF